MPHIAHIREFATQEIYSKPVPVYFPVRQMAVHLRHALADARFLSSAADSGGEASRKCRERRFLYIPVAETPCRDAASAPVPFQKAAQLRDELRQTLPVSAHDKEIIHIAPVIPLAQSTLHKLVEHVQVDITEKLRGKVARWAGRVLRAHETGSCRKAIPPSPCLFPISQSKVGSLKIISRIRYSSRL